MKSLRIVVALLILVTALVADARPSNKWRIKCNGSADAAGEIVLTIAAQGGTSAEVVVAVPKGTTENAVAVLLRDALKDALKGSHKVERDDWEDVLVKKRYGEPDFEVILEDNSVAGLAIKVRRE